MIQSIDYPVCGCFIFSKKKHLRGMPNTTVTDLNMLAVHSV